METEPLDDLWNFLGSLAQPCYILFLFWFGSWGPRGAWLAFDQFRRQGDWGYLAWAGVFLIWPGGILLYLFGHAWLAICALRADGWQGLTDYLHHELE